MSDGGGGAALGTVLLLAAIPGLSNLAGAVLAEARGLSGPMLSRALHLATGIVVGVVSIELVPPALEHAPAWIVVVAFVAGGGVAAGMERVLAVAQRRFGNGGGREATAWMIYFGVCVDLLADGLMIGAGTSVSVGLGVALALGQAPADFPEGFASVATLRDAGVSRRRRLFVAVAFLVPVLAGAVVGFWILREQSLATRWVVLAFTAGMLLTVALEEMLVQAHTRKGTDGDEGPLEAMLLVAGFGLFALLSSYL